MLLARWGLSADTVIEWHRDKGESFDKRFRGYEVELRLIQPIGQALFYPWQIDVGGKPSHVAEPHSETYIANGISKRTAILRMRIWREPRVGFLEGWWERDLRAIRWSIRDVDEQTSARDLDALLRLLRTHARRGRPLGSIFRDRDGLLDACRAAKAELPRELRITQDKLAAELNIDPRTLRYALHDFQLCWDDIVRL